MVRRQGRPPLAERRQRAEEHWQLDVRQLQRQGLLRSGWRGTWGWPSSGKPRSSVDVAASAEGVTLSYECQGQPYLVQVPIEWTPCTYGGRRAWFRCPEAACARRCALLYVVGGQFACRPCHGLAYASQQVGLVGRMTRKADKLRERLGPDPDEPVRPKGMHTRTFESLVAAADMADLLAYERLMGRRRRTS